MKSIVLAASMFALAAAQATVSSDRAKTKDWFLDNVYGRRPAAAENVAARFVELDPPRETKDGKAIRRRVKVEYSGPLGDGSFSFLAFIPKSDKPVPAAVLLCNRPEAMPIDDDSKAATDFWPRDEIVGRGYAAIAFYLSDLAAETYRAETALASGVFKVFGPKYAERKPSDWGVLSAWAWGASRVMDWIERTPELDAKKVMVVGHSRGGKCALVAGIVDERFAMVCANNSGRGGAQLNKMRLPLSEPWDAFRYWGVGYWFAEGYERVFGGGADWSAPYDQDDWLALVSPRILCVGSGAADDWAGPEAECAAAKSAEAAWWRDGAPENCQYGVREGDHGLLLVDWRRYLDFADARWRGTTVVVDGNDSAAIQRALDMKARPLTVVIPKGVYDVTSTLRIGSHTTIKAHPEARLVLNGGVRHRAGDFLLSNADEKGGNEDIAIEGGVWDGNKEIGFNLKEPPERKFHPDAWSGVTLNFRKVKNLRLHDMTLANSVTFNARFCEVDDFDIRRIKIVSPVVKNNQVGLHFGGFTFNGVVDGVEAVTKGQTNDDLIALSADDLLTRHENRGTVNGPITNVVVRNVRAEDCHCLVRLQRAYNHIRDVTIENCEAGCRYSAVNGDDARKWIANGGASGGTAEGSLPPSTGALENVLVRNVRCWATARNGFPLVKIDGVLRGRGVEFDGFVRDMAKDVDPDRPLAADRRTLEIMGADGLPAQPAWNRGRPHFNGPKVFGATPGRLFRFVFPVRGAREGLAFSVAKGALPDGVALDAGSGLLSGRADAGEYAFTVRAENREGAAERDFRLIVGEGKLMLTPQLGWSSWNAYANDISGEIALNEAQAMVEKGLASRGYAAINIDAGWQGDREQWGDHALLANAKFPDIQGLFAKIHALGLRVGLYSSPMIFTWGSAESVLYQGSTTFPVDYSEPGHNYGIGKTHKERADAALWAKWGVDYIKYDWGCDTKPKFAKRMREALDATGRDVYLSVCTDCLVEDAEEHAKYAQIVRGNRDIVDRWKTGGDKPHGVADMIPYQRPWLGHVRPGFWYDLDMMGLGPMYLGGHGQCFDERQKRVVKRIGSNLTHNETAFHFLYWAFSSNPIHLSCRMTELDDFTLNVISDERALEVLNDYPFAAPQFEDRGDGVVVGIRRLSDGRVAKAYFNFADECRETDGIFLPPHFARLMLSDL